MIGPGEDLVGGISTIAKMLVPVLEQEVDLLYLSTTRQRPQKEATKISYQNLVSIVSQYTRFVSTLYRFRPQIIHLHTSQRAAWLKDIFFIVVGKVYQCQVVVHVHTADFDLLYGKRTRFEQFLTRRVMSFADAVIAVSEEWRRRLAQIVPVDQIITLRNCIATDTIPPSLSNSNNINALFLGSVGQRKGVFDLLEAMRELKLSASSFHLWIAGDEEKVGDMNKAQTRLEELHLKDTCQLIGTIQGAKKIEFLSQASLFVLPSYNEGLPIALLEALSAGLAVITTPVGGIPEIIKDGYNGFLVPPGDIKALAEKLTILANDQDLREAMGRRNREIAKQELDVKPYVARLTELYNSLIAAS